MLSEQRLQQIAKMENILNQAETLMAEMEALQEKWQNLQPEIGELFEYYFNGDWRADYAAFDEGEIPAGTPCGVLSEDSVYNLVASQQGIAETWIELADKVVQK